MRYHISATGLLLLVVAVANGQKTGSTKPRQIVQAQRNSGAPQYGVLSINNLTSWMRYDGPSNHAPSGGPGLTFPRGTAGVVYQDELVWGAKVFKDAARTQPYSPSPTDMNIRVGGGTYSVGTKAGAITSVASGTAEDPTGSDVRVYRIRRDFAFLTVVDARREAAAVYEVAELDVTPQQMDAIRAQFALDWQQWPVGKGAPFIDRNGNGTYEAPPSFNADPGSGPLFTPESLITGSYDEPGVAGGDPNTPADEVLWTVFNDLNVTQTQSFEGSLPVGFELQRTVWGYHGKGEALENSAFVRVVIINKGGVDIDNTANTVYGTFWLDSVYVGLWSDFDLGDAGDDLLGVDSVQGMAYAYNGSPLDVQFQPFALPPPSVGSMMLSGPLVASPSDSGFFGLRRRWDVRNLAPSSFSFMKAGDPYAEPPTGPAAYLSGSGQWWKMLRGYAPTGDLTTADVMYIAPPATDPTFFPFGGDPLTGSGWVDGLGQAWSFAPGDVRTLLNVGPFRMAPGDTQEVVYALACGMGSDRLSSLAVLRSTAGQLREVYQRGLGPFARLDSATAAVSYGGPNSATVSCSVVVQEQGVSRVSAIARSGQTELTRTDLVFDPITARYAGELTVTRQLTPVIVDFDVEVSGGRLLHGVGVFPSVTVAGPLDFTPTVVSENLNSDGAVNPGENVRLRLTVQNGTSFTIRQLTVRQGEAELGFGDISAGLSSNGPAYVALDASTYLAFTAPTTGTEAIIRVIASDADLNVWNADIVYPLTPLTGSTGAAMLQHPSGRADGEPQIIVVAADQILDHMYEFRGHSSVPPGVPGFSLVDVTASTTLIDHQPLPDELGHAYPMIDGLRLRRGTLDTTKGIRSDGVVWAGPALFAAGGGNALGLEAFGGSVGYIDPAKYFSAMPMAVPPTDLRAVKLVFPSTSSPDPGAFTPSSTDSVSYAYRFLRGSANPPAQPGFASWIVNAASGYAFQDYRVSAPMAAYDIDANPPQRLAVGFLENNVAAGTVDGFYWPPVAFFADNTSSAGPREWLFVMNSPYTGSTANGAWQDVLTDPAIPIMYMCTWTRANGFAWGGTSSVTITPYRPVGDGDVWVFNPMQLSATVQPDDVPVTFGLSQNYPNPFNPSTTIEYSVASRSRVVLRVFDLLGREVARLADGAMDVGTHVSVWNAGVASGMYFCRLEAEPFDGSARFTQTRKLILIK